MGKTPKEEPAALLPPLRKAILEDKAVLPPAERKDAAFGTPSDPLVAAYVERVRHRAYTTTDEHIAELRAAGLSEDQIFELTVAAAFGAAMHRLDKGMAAIDAAGASADTKRVAVAGEG